MKREIYYLNKGKIEIYNIKPLVNKINLFLKNELNKIPEDEIVLDYIPKKNILVPKKNIIYKNYDYILKKSHDKNNKDIINKSIYNGLYNGKIKKLYREDKKDLILLELLYIYSNKRIQLTEDIANEFLIEEGEYDSIYINKETLDNIKNLFQIHNNPLYKIDINELKKYYDTNLVKESFEDKLYYLEESSKIYEKLK